MTADPLRDAVPPAAHAARVVVVTRDGCHLCVDALAAVADVCAERQVAWQAVDVDSDPALAEQLTAHVPVLYVDGGLVSYWFVDPDRLRGLLV